MIRLVLLGSAFALAFAILAPASAALSQCGIASWYGPGFHGRTTASGERFDQYAMTAAHRTLPFGTTVRVTVPSTGLSIDVRINDRGPHVGGRVIDLSRGAAEALGVVAAGVARVRITILDEPAALPGC